jgi:hypothetical protein
MLRNRTPLQDGCKHGYRPARGTEPATLEQNASGGSMSDSVDWNTKAIREFKAAFGARNNRGYFSSEPPYDHDKAYNQARDMLQKRWHAANLTLQDLAGTHGTSSLVAGLRTEFNALSLDSDTTLKKKPATGKEADTSKAALIEGMIGLTNKWTAFEARCIVTRNELARGGGDDGVRQDLAAQATDLMELLQTLEKQAASVSPKPDLSTLKGDVRALFMEAGLDGSTIADPLAFRDRIDACRAAMRTATKAVIDRSASDKKTELYQAELQKMYGITVTPSSTLGFPYESFLDTLAMVPRDHARNPAMKQVIGEYLGLSTGGDYTEQGEFAGRIRINPIVSLNFLGAPYRDPESDPTAPETQRVDTWTATTLHEIGHAVDAAYKIMDVNGGGAGCGGWVKVNPLDYMKPQKATFENRLRQSASKEKPFTDLIGTDAYDSVLVNVLVGNKKPQDYQKDLTTYFGTLFDTEYGGWLDQVLDDCQKAVARVNMALQPFFPVGRLAGVYATEKPRFESIGTVAADLAILAQAPSTFDAGQFWAQFKTLVETPADTPEALIVWTQMQCVTMGQGFEVSKTTGKDRLVAAWTEAVIRALPPPVDLKPYLAGSKPWKTDLSKAKINGIAASHEAYSGSSTWWRYGAADRTGTYVTDYQWRAPGEWFAELYAITWFAKKEPPNGVAGAVRTYLYGGHLGV